MKSRRITYVVLMADRRKRWIVAAAFVSAFFLGITSVALAADAFGGISVFYGPEKIGGSYLCAAQQAGINNDSEGAFLNTTSLDNDQCSNSDQRNAGQLGAIAYLWKGTSGQGGVLYSVSPWTYNDYRAPSSFAITYCPGSCPSAGYYSAGKGRMWNSDAQVYETASYLSYSPDLTFP